MRKPAATLFALALALPALADTISHFAPVGPGGGYVTGGVNIESQISVGDPVSGGVASGGSIQDKGGYTGQLHDVRSLALSASPTTVPEETTRQISANALLDDDTLLAPAPNTVAWSVQSGALTGIDTNGLATAATVYQDSPATVLATFCGLNSTLALTVLDTDPDNFGTYASDGLPDSWQFTHFGLDNPAAAPALDPDADGQDNLLEYLALVDPTDPLSFLCTELSGKDALTFSPFSAGGRTYTLLASPDLNPANFAPVASTSSDDAGERTLTHTAHSGGARLFYKLEITDQ